MVNTVQKGKKGRKCFSPYYNMRITLLSDGRVSIDTCCHNVFRKQNRVIAAKDILGVWNSSQFQFQRHLLSNQDWSFCLGAGCCNNSYQGEAVFMKNNQTVTDAIMKHETYLRYAPKTVLINLSRECNNNCYFCFQFAERNKKHSLNVLSRDLEKELKRDIIPSAKKVIFTGGESLFAQNSLDMINWTIAEFPKKNVLIQTNGTLLKQFGLNKILNSNIHLSVSLYGMNAKTYKKITGRDCFGTVFDSVRYLLDQGYDNLHMVFIVCRETLSELDDFCRFVARYPKVRGTVNNEAFSGKKYFSAIRIYKNKYKELFPRLTFLEVSESLSLRIIRHFYNPVHSLRYMLYKRMMRK